ncbi:tetratricopeptide repeat protein [Streptomyces sp. NPDC004044]
MPRIHAMYTRRVYASEREEVSSAQRPWTPTTVRKTPIPRATGSGKEDAWPGLTRRPRSAPRDPDSGTGRGATGPVRLRVHLAQRPHYRPRGTQSAHLQELAICEETSDAAGQGAVWNNLGTSPARVGRLAEAVKALRTATTVYTEVGNLYTAGSALNNLGAVLRHLGQFDEAIDAHTAAAAIQREAGAPHGEIAALHNLAVIHNERRRRRKTWRGWTTTRTFRSTTYISRTCRSTSGAACGWAECPGGRVRWSRPACAAPRTWRTSVSGGVRRHVSVNPSPRPPSRTDE